MENSAIKEEETKGKRSNRWLWPVGALIVVFLAVAVSSQIGFFFSDRSSLSSPHKESGIHKGSQQHDLIKVASPLLFLRERPPTTYSVTFESFGKMMEQVKDGYYESLPFTVDGYNWTLIIYPNGITAFTRGLVYLYVRTR